MQIDTLLARRTAIQSEQAALSIEDERIAKELRRYGLERARSALREAGFVLGESIVVERRMIGEHTYRMGILLTVAIDWPPTAPGDEWTVCVRTRSVLRNGKPGEAFDRRSFRVSDPAELPQHLKVTGTVDRERALTHPRIRRVSRGAAAAELQA